MRYLDTKADLTFKKVFGEHPDLVISLLNALLPLKTEEQIVQVEYLPAELVPANPLRKNSIVDVRCQDQRGRQFIVEMQMVWTPEFKQRVLFNASKAYVRPLNKKEDFALLQPVYSLNLVNDIFETDLPDEYYHYYRLVHEQHSDRIIDGLHLVFVELPKFRLDTITNKKMHILWMRYLTEIDERTDTAPQELLDDPEVGRALELVRESAFTPEQLAGYEEFWDAVRVEATLVNKWERMRRKYEETESQLQSSKEKLQSTMQELQSKDQELQSKDQELQSKDQELQSKDQELQSKDQELQSKDQELQSKDQELQSKDQELQKAKALLAALGLSDQEIAEKLL